MFRMPSQSRQEGHSACSGAGGGVGSTQRKFGGSATKARRMDTHEPNDTWSSNPASKWSSRHSAQLSCYQHDLSSAIAS